MKHVFENKTTHKQKLNEMDRKKPKIRPVQREMKKTVFYGKMSFHIHTKSQ